MSHNHGYEVGNEVLFNGNHPGYITEVCTGQLEGMVVVRGERGSVCIGAHPLNLRMRPAVCKKHSKVENFHCAHCGEYVR